MFSNGLNDKTVPLGSADINAKVRGETIRDPPLASNLRVRERQPKCHAAILVSGESNL